MVNWGSYVFDMEHEGLLVFISAVKVAAISSTEALVDRAVEPHDGIEATSLELYLRFFLSGRLDEKHSVVKFSVSANGIEFDIRLVSAQSLLEKLCLSVSAREIDQHPAVRLGFQKRS